MDHGSTPTAPRALADLVPNTQENQELVNTRISAHSLVSGDHGAKLSRTNDSCTFKHRRALHTIDNNSLRLALNSPRRSLLEKSSRAAKKTVETCELVTTLIEISKEESNTEKELGTGPKRARTIVSDEVKTVPDSERQLELQESENLAWMDMMLALLEKRYGANSALPICLTDLEAANVFQLPQQKKIKTENTSAQSSVKSRSSLDASRIQISASCASDKSNMSARSLPTSVQFGHEQEQTKESKRQRLLLRYAQQIQASSVSSSTSCGCKTGCLKMYCMCFSSRGFCHAGCACDDCKNGRENQTERVQAIQNYLANDPRAFSYASLPQDANTTGFLHLLPRCGRDAWMSLQKIQVFEKVLRVFPEWYRLEASHLLKTREFKSSTAPAPGLKPFHPVQITVTKQPRRNQVGKTLRLSL